MATIFCNHGIGVDDGTIPAIPGNASFRGSPIKALIGSIALDTQAPKSGDVLDWGPIPKGAVPVLAGLFPTVSLGTSTITLGTAASAAAFRAAATLTSANAFTFATVGTLFATELAAATRFQSTIATADLPTTAGARLIAFLLFTAALGG